MNHWSQMVEPTEALRWHIDWTLISKTNRCFGGHCELCTLRGDHMVTKCCQLCLHVILLNTGMFYAFKLYMRTRHSRLTSSSTDVSNHESVIWTTALTLQELKGARFSVSDFKRGKKNWLCQKHLESTDALLNCVHVRVKENSSRKRC